jgi:hypothetical protein
MQENTELYELSADESRSGWGQLAHVAGWLALLALIVVTGAHAISLVISQIGMASGVLGLVRVLSPVLVEVVAAIVAVGFAAHQWRGQQKTIGLLVEVLWLVFAGLNLVASFTVESGDQLPAALRIWLAYGLPLSALAAGAMFYAMLRADPRHRRAAEMQAAAEAHRMLAFKAEREVMTSSHMASVLRQRGWLNTIERLERQGYTQQQIRFLLSGVPALQALAPAGSGLVADEVLAAEPAPAVAEDVPAAAAAEDVPVADFLHEPAEPAANGHQLA